MTSHSEVVAHLVRRGCHKVHAAMAPAMAQGMSQGMAVVSDMPESMHHTYKNHDGIVSSLAVAVIGFTIVLALLVLTSMHYTFTIVKTLAMVEDTTTTYVVRQEKNEKSMDADALAEDEVDAVLVVKNVAITSNIRSTIRHLHNRAGCLARWRGLRAMVAYGLSYSLLNGTLARIIYSPMSEDDIDMGMLAISRAISSLASKVALAVLSMTWTHIVISESSSKAWYQRIPSIKTWKKVAGATAINAVCRQFAMALPAFLFFSMELNNKALYTGESLENGETNAAIIKLISIGAIGVLAFVGIAIPSDIALVRVQASLLPGSDNTIVPFDRTFGGKVVPVELGGSGFIGYFDAWRSVDRSARLRLFKLYVKTFAVELCLHAVFAYIVATEVLVLAAPVVAGFAKMHRNVAEVSAQ